VRCFVCQRRRSHTGFVSERALQPLLGYLREVGVLATEERVDSPWTGVLGRYESYLTEERAILAERRARYLASADEFLQGRAPARLRAADVTAFIDAQARQPCLAERLTALRSLLRFLFLDGTFPVDLVYAVPSAPSWRQPGLPKAIDSAQFRAVLATCDRRTAVGCRDYAALLLMGRLGLRAGEVTGLLLDDFDWDRGEVIVRGKGGTVGRLPLPADVGRAVVAHLRRRVQRDDTRAVFLRLHAPHRSVTRSTITALASRALRSAGIPSGAAHRLRHTAATQMLRHGASLTEIAQVLRHRHIDTTAIYAKVDHKALRMLAQPWPAQDRIDATTLRPLAPPWPGGAA
jgi:integrase/recombinase XerD